MANKWDERKKALEDEYFVKKEKELIAKLKAKQATDKEAEGKPWYMRCPKCGEPLKERSFTKVVVDQCTGCGGIWFDPGEVEQVAKKDEAGWLGKLWQKIG
ncbi:MAG TPA: zf-TFIIB domain-containing protein [Candidatus Acidoferrales bacterium]|nr:zf-TFIIB domain-containing protein [Candidatus Acidoferrales bacterium]